MKGYNVTEAVREIADSLRSTLQSMVVGRYGIAVSGSIGKGTNDHKSDFDFRLYFDEYAGEPRTKDGWEQVRKIIDMWRERGRVIDGVWAREIAEIDSKLSAWCSGDMSAPDLTWTIWGYYLPTDIANQHIIDDPSGVLAGWKAKLSTYPVALKKAVIDKYLPFIRYWRDDYHYEFKMDRKDSVFAFGLAMKITHAIVQLIFALNEHHFVGDGKNMDFIAGMEIAPVGFSEKVDDILLCTSAPGDLPMQRLKLIALITEVDRLVEHHAPALWAQIG